MARNCDRDLSQYFEATISGVTAPFCFYVRFRSWEDPGVNGGVALIGQSGTLNNSIEVQARWAQTSPGNPLTMITRDSSSYSQTYGPSMGTSGWYSPLITYTSSSTQGFYVNGTYYGVGPTRNCSPGSFTRAYFGRNGTTSYASCYLQAAALWEGIAATADMDLMLRQGVHPLLVAPSYLKHCWLFQQPNATDDVPDIISGATAVQNGSPAYISDAYRLLHPRQRDVFSPPSPYRRRGHYVPDQWQLFHNPR